MVRDEEGNDHIRNWMRNRNSVEFIGLWETLHNPNFKPVEFDTFRKQAGLNNFNLTPKKWIEKTNAIGIISKSGRYGGTYAIMISENIDKVNRYRQLKKIAKSQLKTLDNQDFIKSLKRLNETTFINEEKRLNKK